MRKIAFVFIALMVIASCSKEPEVKEQNMLIGTWQESEITGGIEICTYIFKEDFTGIFSAKVNGVKMNDVNFNYTFDKTKMELNVMWIGVPAWENDKVIISIQNGNILIWRDVIFYKQ